VPKRQRVRSRRRKTRATPRRLAPSMRPAHRTVAAPTSRSTRRRVDRRRTFGIAASVATTARSSPMSPRAQRGSNAAWERVSCPHRRARRASRIARPGPMTVVRRTCPTREIAARAARLARARRHSARKRRAAPSAATAVPRRRRTSARRAASTCNPTPRTAELAGTTARRCPTLRRARPASNAVWAFATCPRARVEADLYIALLDRTRAAKRICSMRRAAVAAARRVPEPHRSVRMARRAPGAAPIARARRLTFAARCAWT